MPTLNVRLDDRLHDELRRLAEGSPERLSINQVIVQALQLYLGLRANGLDEGSWRRGEARGLESAARWCDQRAEFLSARDDAAGVELEWCAEQFRLLARGASEQAVRVPAGVLTQHPVTTEVRLEAAPSVEPMAGQKKEESMATTMVTEFDRAKAIDMWRTVVSFGYDYEYALAVRDIARACGLGELTPAATDKAVRWIRSYYGTHDGRLTRSSRDRWRTLTATPDPGLLGMWADAIQRAARESGGSPRPLLADDPVATPTTSSPRIASADAVAGSNFPSTLFNALRKMDEEATNQSYWKGQPFPTGLRYYDKHERPDDPSAVNPRFCPERAWPERLAVVLPQIDGQFRAVTQQPYPGSRQTCDLVVTLPGADRLWIEMKGAWRYNRDVPERIDVTMWRGRELWEKHLKSPTEGAAKDFLKLASLARPHARYVGVLVLGFDLDPKFVISERDIDEMKANAGYDPKLWTETYECWPDEHQENDKRHGESGFRVRCWLWYRPVE